MSDWDDWDLEACLDYNDVGLSKSDIREILAVWEGENDGDDWRWIVRLADDQFAFIQGWCDYTGWDCQSGATAVRADTPEDAARYALGEQNLEVVEVSNPGGMGRMISILTGIHMSNAQEVYDSLLAQLNDGKAKTWREAKDEELGVRSVYVPEDQR